MEIDAQNLASVATMVGVVFSVVSAISKLGMDYLVNKLSNTDRQEKLSNCSILQERITAKLDDQQTKMTHMIQSQNEHISRLLHQNGEQLKYMAEASHNAELRHQITITKLDNILEKL